MALEYELTFAGIPFCLDLATKVSLPNSPDIAKPYQSQIDLLNELDKLIPFCYLQEFTPTPSFPGNNLSAIAYPYYQNQFTDIRIGDWYYPTGATRWSIFRGLATSNQVKEMLKATEGNVAQQFIMKVVPLSPTLKELSTSIYTLTTDLFMLPPRPLAEHGGEFDGLYLVTLVDERYYWQYHSSTIRPKTTTTWNDLISTLGTDLDLITDSEVRISSQSTIPSVYSSPEVDSQFWTNEENTARLLDAVAFNTGRIVVRKLDGTYILLNTLESQTNVNTNRESLATSIRIAGGDIFYSGQNLPAGNLTKSKNSIVPEKVVVSFPKYITSDDPVPHLVNSRYINPRPSAWHENSYGDVHSIFIPLVSLESTSGSLTSGILAASGTVHAIHDTSKALLPLETSKSPSNSASLTNLATRLALDFYNDQVVASLDEVYPGTFAWNLEGIHDVVWTVSVRNGMGATRVFRTEWNWMIPEMQHGTPEITKADIPASERDSQIATTTNRSDKVTTLTVNTRGVGGHSVAQSIRDSIGVIAQTQLSSVLTNLSGANTASFQSIANFPTQNRWRGKIDDEIILFEGTSGGSSTTKDVNIVYRAIDNTELATHLSGASVSEVIPHTNYGVNLVSYEKGQWVFPGIWSSGGIQELVVVPQTQTVLVFSDKFKGTIPRVSGTAVSGDIKLAPSWFVSLGKVNGFTSYGPFATEAAAKQWAIENIGPDQVPNLTPGITPGSTPSLVVPETSPPNVTIPEGDTKYWITVIKLSFAYADLSKPALALSKDSSAALFVPGDPLYPHFPIDHSVGPFATLTAVEQWVADNYKGTVFLPPGLILSQWAAGGQKNRVLALWYWYVGPSGGVPAESYYVNVTNMSGSANSTVGTIGGTSTAKEKKPRYHSGAVQLYNPKQSLDPDTLFNPWGSKELVWVVERNGLPLQSGVYYDGQFVGFSASGPVAPIYAVSDKSAKASIAFSGPSASGPPTLSGPPLSGPPLSGQPPLPSGSYLVVSGFPLPMPSGPYVIPPNQWGGSGPLAVFQPPPQQTWPYPLPGSGPYSNPLIPSGSLTGPVWPYPLPGLGPYTLPRPPPIKPGAQPNWPYPLPGSGPYTQATNPRENPIASPTWPYPLPGNGPYTLSIIPPNQSGSPTWPYPLPGSGPFTTASGYPYALPDPGSGLVSVSGNSTPLPTLISGEDYAMVSGYNVAMIIPDLVVMAPYIMLSGLSSPIKSGIYTWQSGVAYPVISGSFISFSGEGGALSSGSVQSGNVGNNAITSGNIASGQIGSIQLASGAVRSGYIGNNAVVSGSIASGQIGSRHLSSGSILSGHAGDNSILSGSIASGQISANHLASGIALVTSGSVQSGHIGNNAVVSGSIASGQVSANHLASGIALVTSGSVQSGHIGNNAVVSGSIASGQVSANHLASGVSLVTSGSVQSGHIGNNAVVSGSIASGQLSSFHISSGGLNSGAISSGSLTQNNFGSGQIPIGAGTFNYAAGEDIVNFGAVTINSGGVLVNIQDNSGLTFPAIGIANGSVSSGGAVSVVTQGIFNTTNNTGWSGWVGYTLWVASGRLVSSGNWGASQSHFQRAGTAISGGIMLNLSQDVWNLAQLGVMPGR